MDAVMETLHPHDRAFWEPIKFALVAGLFAGLFGWGITGCDMKSVYVGVIVGSFTAFWVYLFWAIHWFAIVRKSYEPAKPQIVDEPEPVDEMTLEYTVTCRTGDTTHHLRFLPCSPSDLQHIAMRFSEGTPLTFEHWKSELGEGQFRAVIAWMDLNHWLTYNGPKKAVTMLEYGECVLGDLAVNGIQDALPHQKTGYAPVDSWTPRQIKTVVK